MAGEQINVPTPAPLPMQQTGGIFSQPLGAMGNGSDGGLLEGAGAGVQQAASEVGGPSWFRETMQSNGFNANGLMQNTQVGQQLGAVIDKGKEGLKTMWQNSSIDANLAPAAVPEAMKNTLTAQSNLNLLATAGNVFGQDMMNDAMPELGHVNAAYIKPEFGKGYMAGAALKGAATGTTLGPVGTFMGAGIGMVKAGVQKDKLMNEWQEAYDERIANERLNNTNAARQMSGQVYSTYNTQGQFLSPMMEQGGAIPPAPDYETEGGEVMLASPNDKPIAMGQGKYKKMTDNLYKIEGPRHEGGGVPTAGAQQPFTDNLGNDHDSPYVFSDTEDFRFDASEILGML